LHFVCLSILILRTTIHRKIELNADRYAASILANNNVWLVSSFKKVEDINTKILLFIRVFSLLIFAPFQTHPTIEERINHIASFCHNGEKVVYGKKSNKVMKNLY